MPPPLDTSVRAQEVQRELYRRMDGSERLSIAFRLTHSSATLLLQEFVGGIRITRISRPRRP